MRVLKRIIMISLAIVAGLYLAAAAAMFTFQRQLQYFPGQRAPSPVEAGFDGAVEHVLTAADGTRIVIWYAPAPAGAATVLYFQGNGGEIADRRDRWAAYRAAGLGVAFLGYRGYGGNDGQPTETGLHDDAATAYDWLMDQGVAADHLALVGESLGTGLAVRLAATRPVAALVLEAPYTAIVDIAAEAYPWLPVRLLMLDQYRSIDHIAQIKAPLFVTHGEADGIIPFHFGKALFDAAPEPKEFLAAPRTGHNDLFGPATWAAEIAFLTRVLPKE